MTIRHEGDIWEVIGKGVTVDGKIYCHLASTTRKLKQKNGYVPVQMCDWINEELLK